MNTVESFVPPMLIFKRRRFKNDLNDGEPLLTISSQNGWITSNLFTLWIDYLIKYLPLTHLTKKQEEKKVLLYMASRHLSFEEDLSPSECYV